MSSSSANRAWNLLAVSQILSQIAPTWLFPLCQKIPSPRGKFSAAVYYCPFQLWATLIKCYYTGNWAALGPGSYWRSTVKAYLVNNHRVNRLNLNLLLHFVICAPGPEVWDINTAEWKKNLVEHSYETICNLLKLSLGRTGG